MIEVNNNSIKPTQIITVFNILRALGLNTSHRGSKFINKSVQLILNSNNDIIVLEEIYIKVSNIYDNITPLQVKNDINYAINSRNTSKSVQNFESIFGFEYDAYYFTNKNIIEEIARVIMMDKIAFN